VHCGANVNSWLHRVAASWSLFYSCLYTRCVNKKYPLVDGLSSLCSVYIHIFFVAPGMFDLLHISVCVCVCVCLLLFTLKTGLCLRLRLVVMGWFMILTVYIMYLTHPRVTINIVLSRQCVYHDSCALSHCVSDCRQSI